MFLLLWFKNIFKNKKKWFFLVLLILILGGFILKKSLSYPDDEDFLNRLVSDLTQNSFQNHDNLEFYKFFENPQSFKTHYHNFLQLQEKLLELEKQNRVKPDPYSEKFYRFITGKQGFWLDEKKSIPFSASDKIEFFIPNSKNLPKKLKTIQWDFAFANLQALLKETLSLKIEIINQNTNQILKEELVSVQHFIFTQNKNPYGIPKTTGWHKVKINLESYHNQPLKIVLTLQKPLASNTSSDNWVGFVANPNYSFFDSNPLAKEEHSKLEKYPVIYIVFDAMAQPYLSTYNPKSGLTPFLKSSEDEWIVFNHLYSPAVKTRIFLSQFFTGQTPDKNRHSINMHVFPQEEKDLFYQDPNLTTLPQVLNSHGYFTYQIGNSGFSHPGLKTGFDYGFDASLEFQKRPADTTGIAWFLLHSLTTHHNKPFFTYVHFNTPHHPRTTPFKYLLKGLFNYPSFFWRLDMLASIVYTDNIIKTLATFFKKTGLWDKSIIIISADHGTSHSFTNFYSHNHSQAHVQIPFLMHVPQKLTHHLPTLKKRVTTPLSALSFAPTLLDILNLKPEPRFAQPSFKKTLFASFKDDKKNSLLVSYDNESISMVYQERWKYILFFSETERFILKDYIYFGKKNELPSEILYDLEKDPQETTNVIEQHPQLRDFFRKKVKEKPLMPEINFLNIYPNPHKKNEEITIKFSSKGQWLKMKFLNPMPKNSIKKTAHGYEVVIKDFQEPNTLIFETRPSRVFTEIQILVDKKPVSKKQVFCGPYGLNLYENPLVLKENNDFLSVLTHYTPPVPTFNSSLPAFQFFRMDSRRYLRQQQKGQQENLDTGMKDVLKAWGYIQ